MSTKNTDKCLVAVMVRSMAARSMKVFGGHVNYGTNHGASIAGELYIIPRSQVTRIIDLGHGQHVLELPRWLVEKENLGKHLWKNHLV